MSGGLEIISLGGCGGFGQNATLLIWEGRGLLVDFGIGFPKGVPVGASRVVPQAEPLLERCDRFLGVALTHAHDDHAAGLAYLPSSWAQAPVYGTPYTLAVAQHRHRRIAGRRFDERPVASGLPIDIEPFRLRWVRVTHSAPDSHALVIDTPAGTLVHTGDFKLDPSPWRGPASDLDALREAGARGVELLLIDATGARRPGRTRSESEVYPALEEEIAGATGQVFVSTFASHLHRLEAVSKAAAAAGRKVALLGQRMNTTVRHGIDAGIFAAPAGLIVSLEEVGRLPKDQRLYLAGGCQGEPGSSISRISFGSYGGVRAEPGDHLVLSSSIVPGSEVQVGQLLDRFLRLGATVVAGADRPELHASGHGSREEIGELIRLLRPAAVVPVHGDRIHLDRAATLAREILGPRVSVEIIERGDILRLAPAGLLRAGTVELPPRVLDEAGLHLGEELLRDRRRLAAAGVVVISIRPETAPGGEAEIRAEALGIAEWEGENGRAAAVESAVRAMLASHNPDSAEIEAVIARRVAHLLRGSPRSRPQVVVIVEPTAAAPRRDEDKR